MIEHPGGTLAGVTSEVDYKQLSVWLERRMDAVQSALGIFWGTGGFLEHCAEQALGRLAGEGKGSSYVKTVLQKTQIK